MVNKKVKKEEVEEPIKESDAMLEGFEVARTVTVPTLKFPDDTTKFLEIASEIKTKETIDPQTKKPTTIEVAEVVDLEQEGKKFSLVFGKVLQLELEKNYPEKDYVGRVFKITKSKPANGKRYRVYTVLELKKISD